MANLPNKEIRSINESFNIYRAVSWRFVGNIFTIVLTTMLNISFNNLPQNVVKWLMVGIVVLFVLVNALPMIIFKIKKYLIANAFLTKKAALKLFDEDIVYCTMTAYEYHQQCVNLAGTPNGNTALAGNVKSYYNDEIAHYVNRAIDGLTRFNSNLAKIVYNPAAKIDKNMISKKRVLNITNILDELIILNNISVENDIPYKNFIYKVNQL